MHEKGLKERVPCTAGMRAASLTGPLNALRLDTPASHRSRPPARRHRLCYRRRAALYKAAVRPLEGSTHICSTLRSS
eukprot:14694124-Alexandrium_andersonii.AAC.1